MLENQCIYKIGRVAVYEGNRILFYFTKLARIFFWKQELNGDDSVSENL